MAEILYQRDDLWVERLSAGVLLTLKGIYEDDVDQIVIRREELSEVADALVRARLKFELEEEGQ